MPFVYIISLLFMFKWLIAVALFCSGDHGVRCVKRKLLLEALSNELPNGTIRYSSKVVAIEESGFFKLVHLADGTVIKTKVKFQTPFLFSK